MKKSCVFYLRYVCFGLTLFLILFLNFSDKVYADESVELAYYDSDDFSNDTINGQFVMSRNGSLCLSFKGENYGLISFTIKDDNGSVVYSKEYDFDFESKKFNIDNLNKGTYTIQINADEYLCDLFLSIQAVYVADEMFPDFSLSNDYLLLDKGKTDSLKVIVSPSNLEYNVVWNSKNNKIVTVDNQGKVKAKSIGETDIIATVYYKNTVYKTLTCDIEVQSGWKYKDYSNAMKKYAKKHKGIAYKDVDKGSICRLYSTPYVTYSNNKVKSQGYASVAYYEFYIELKKKNNGSLSLKLYGANEFVMLDAFDEVDLDVNAFKMKSSNRILNFDSTIVSQDNHYSLKGYYYGKTKSKTLISDADNIDLSKVKKFKTMLGQSSTTYKIACENGSYFTTKFSKAVRNSAIKLVDEYLKLSPNM